MPATPTTPPAGRFAPVATTGTFVRLPKGVYAHHGRFVLKLCVKGRQYVLGTFNDLDTATAERDRAYHSFAPWARRLPADIAPAADLTLLPPNALLERALSELRSMAPEREREGVVAPREVAAHDEPSAAATPPIENTMLRIAEALDRIGDLLRDRNNNNNNNNYSRP